MRPVYPPASVRAGADHLLVYLGIMGPQDGVNQLLAVMDVLVHERGRRNLHLALLGFGDCLDQLRQEAVSRDLSDFVTFTGRVGPDQIADYLSAADIGLGPDLKTPLNDISTMNKTMEYMAYCLPSVSFDLVETRVSAGDAGVFVPSGDIARFADEVERLLDDPDARATLGTAARERVSRELDWKPQAEAYVRVFDRLTATGGHREERAAMGATDARPPEGRQWVDLEDPSALADFVRSRQAPAREEQDV
jgi:glycosyltransferase involved in cell wall biosynthesis